eukprot:g61171.t1
MTVVGPSAQQHSSLQQNRSQGKQVENGLTEACKVLTSGVGCPVALSNSRNEQTSKNHSKDGPKMRNEPIPSQRLGCGILIIHSCSKENSLNFRSFLEPLDSQLQRRLIGALKACGFQRRASVPLKGQSVVVQTDQLQLHRKTRLELRWNPERTGPIPSKSTIANHIRHVRRFAEFAREHGTGRLVDALGKAALLSEFAATGAGRTKIMSSTVGSYLGSLTQLSDFLRPARGVLAWQQTSRWLANLSRQAQQYARIERVYGVGREESDWTMWDLQPFRVAALAEYFAHYDEDAKHRLVTRANYANVREGWLRALRAALLCLLLTPPVPRPGILVNLHLNSSLLREEKEPRRWVINLQDATSLSVQKNKTRAMYGGQLLPLGRQPWPTDELPVGGPAGFVRRSGRSSALDFVLLDLRERVVPAVVGGMQHRPLFPHKASYKRYEGWRNSRNNSSLAERARSGFVRDAYLQLGEKMWVNGQRPARCRVRGWANLLTFKSSRKPAETMVRELEQFEVFTALGGGPPPWGAAGSGGAHLTVFAGAGQHSLDTVNSEYLLPGHRRRKVAEQAQWIEGMLNQRNWHAHVDDHDAVQVYVSPRASEFTRRFSEEGPRLEPLSPEEEKLRQQRRWRVREMRGAALFTLRRRRSTTRPRRRSGWRQASSCWASSTWRMRQNASHLSIADCKNRYNNDWQEVARLGVFSARNSHIYCLPPHEGEPEDLKYVCRFRVRDKVCGWPDRWLTVAEILKEYGDQGVRVDKTPKLLMLMQAFLDQLRAGAVQRISGGVLVQWQPPAPERTEPVVDSKHYPLPPGAAASESAVTRNPAACPDYWGPWFDRNWCIFRRGARADAGRFSVDENKAGGDTLLLHNRDVLDALASNVNN